LRLVLGEPHDPIEARPTPHLDPLVSAYRSALARFWPL
jgi:hypothetical protein